MGVRGTVLQVVNEPGLPITYVIEFLDDKGNSLAAEFIQEDDLEED